MAREVTHTVTDAPPHPSEVTSASATAELAEVSLPEGFSLDEPAETVSEAAPAETPPVAVPAVVSTVETAVQPVVAPAVEAPKGDKGKALKEERDKRKRASARAEFWEAKALDIKRSRDRIRDTLQLRGRTAPRIDDAEIAKLVAEADKADGLGKPVELVLRRMVKAFEEQEVRLEQAFRRREIERAERAFRADHADFESVLQRAGIYDAIGLDETGNWRDPVIGRAVYVDGEDNPAEAAYELGRRLLGEPIDDEWHSHVEAEAATNGRGPVAVPAADLVAATTSAPASTSQTSVAAPAPSSVASSVSADAIREGARQVIERVNDNSQRPRGIRMVRSAGAPDRVELNESFAKYLDGLMESDPKRFQQFMAKNPAIDKWFMSL